MFSIIFEYKDKFSNGKWIKQKCIVSSVEECKKIYGLGIDKDCEYRFIEIKKIS